MPIKGFKLLAHRGARITSPENTIVSFRRSKAEGADGIECDVRLTADGEPILFHDPDARRAAGLRRRIAEMTWNEVRALQVFGSHRVPHLNEAIEFMAGWPEADVYFDLHQDSLRLVEALTRAIASSGTAERSFVLDFYRQGLLLRHAKSLDSRIRISVMPREPWNIVPSVRELGTKSLCVGWDGPDTRILYKTACVFYDVRSAVAQAKAMGASVSGGVANTPRDIRYMLAQGATGIWTDDLAVARRFLETVPCELSL